MSNSASAAGNFSNKLFIPVALLILLLLCGLIGWASLEENVVTGFERLFSFRWGITTFADLCTGFLFTSVWMSYLIGFKRALPWIIALFLLGNPTLIIFLLLRARAHSDLCGMLFIPQARHS